MKFTIIILKSFWVDAYYFFIPNLCDCISFRSFRYIKQPKTMSKEKEKTDLHWSLNVAQLRILWDPTEASWPGLGQTHGSHGSSPGSRWAPSANNASEVHGVLRWPDMTFLTWGWGTKISRIHGFTSKKEFKWNDNHWDIVDIGVLLDFCLSFPHSVFFRPQNNHLKLRAGKRSVNFFRIKPKTHISYDIMRMPSEFSVHLVKLAVEEPFVWQSLQLMSAGDCHGHVSKHGHFLYLLDFVLRPNVPLILEKSQNIQWGINVCKGIEKKTRNSLLYDYKTHVGVVGVVGLVSQLVLPRPRAVPAEVFSCWQSTIEMGGYPPWELKYHHKKKGKSSSNFKRTFPRRSKKGILVL